MLEETDPILAAFERAARKATKGRHGVFGALSGAERRTALRFLKRQEARFLGRQVGFLLPSLSARRTTTPEEVSA